MEEVVVTGSRIARRDFISPSPVVTLDAGDITLAGTTNVDDLLNTMPQFIADAGRSDPEVTGTASLNLRGMGANRTLIMLNGRRFAPSGVRGAVDINSLPAALIDRIEVVTGGASAVYGSDAVAGVVNFMIDTHFEGLEARFQYDVTGKSDGDTLDFSLAGGFGFADGRGNVSGFVNYSNRDPVIGLDRKFTSVYILDDPYTGELLEGGSTVVPEGSIYFPPTLIDGQSYQRVVFNQDGSVRPFAFPDDYYNFASFNNIQSPLKRKVAGVFANYEFAARVRGIFEGLLGRNEVNQQQAPVAVNYIGPVSINSPFLPVESQQIFRESYDPDGDGIADVRLLRRMSEIGPRLIRSRRDTTRLLLGLQGNIADSWRWEANYIYTDVDVDPVIGNSISASRFQQALQIHPASNGCLDPSGGCVPINVFGAGNISAEAAGFVQFGTIENEEKVTEQLANLVLSGVAWQLPAGPVGVALGFEWRKLEGRFEPDSSLLGNDVLGFPNFQPAVGEIEVKEVFGEVLVPLVSNKPLAHYLGVEGALRSSDYRGIGRVTTWKAGGNWAPTASANFRLMYQRAVRAPNIFEAFETQREDLRSSFGPGSDLCSANNDPVGNGLSDICIAQGMDPSQLGIFVANDFDLATTRTGGNPELRPEKSDSLTLGLVLQPARFSGFKASLDYFDIKIDGAILNVDTEGLTVCFASADPDNEYCQGFQRDASGQIIVADLLPRNVAVQKSEGIDLQVQYAFDMHSAALMDGQADFLLSIYATQYFTNGSQASPLTPFYDCAGYFGFACGFSSFGTLPEYKTTTRLTYNTGPLQLSLRWRWISGMKNSYPIFAEQFNLPEPNLAIPKIGSVNYFDLSGSWNISESLLLYGGVNNLFGEDPPLLAGEAPGINTDPAVYDVLGRSYFIGLTFRY